MALAPPLALKLAAGVLAALAVAHADRGHPLAPHTAVAVSRADGNRCAVLFFAAASTRLGGYARSVDLAWRGDRLSACRHGGLGHLPNRSLIDVHAARASGSGSPEAGEALVPAVAASLSQYDLTPVVSPA